MYQNDFKHVTIVHVLKWVPLFSQENGNFLDDHFLNNMAIFFSITLHCCKILASSWMFAHRFPITFLCYWSNHPYYDIRRYVHCTFKRTNTLSRLFLLFTTRFPVKNLKAHIWRTLTGSDAKISRKGQCLSTSSTIGIFMSTGKISWNRSHPNFVRNWQSRCFNSVIRN